MTTLSLPRLNFMGKLKLSTGTGNNAAIDMTGYPVVDEATITLTGFAKSMTKQQFHKYMENYFANMLSDGQNFYSNFFGDFRALFDADTSIVSVELESGATSQDDPLINQPISLLGGRLFSRPERIPAVMVDVDPKDSYSTQIFCDGFRLGQTSSAGSPPPFNDEPTFGFFSDQISRGHATQMNPWRNLAIAMSQHGASATFYHNIPKAGLKFFNQDGDKKIVSPALEALEKAAMMGKGLVVRYTVYLFLQTSPNYNEERQNIGYLVTVGSIAPWSEDEPASVNTVGRGLFPRPDNGMLPSYLEPPPSGKSTFYCFPGWSDCQINGNMLSLDISNCFPDLGGFNTAFQPLCDTPEKATLGELKLYLEHSKGRFDLGVIPNNKQQYQKFGGTVQLDVSQFVNEFAENAQQIFNEGRLSICLQDQEQPVLLESPYQVTLDAKTRGLYLAPGDSRKVSFQVIYKGKCELPEKVQVKIVQEVKLPDNNNPDDKFPRLADHLAHHRPVEADHRTKIVDIPHLVEVDKDGKGSFTLTVVQPGFCQLVFYPPDFPAFPCSIEAGGIGLGFCSYMSVRVLPEAEEYYDDIEDDHLTYEFIYSEILQYYDYILPAMSKLIDFSSRDEVIAKAVQFSGVVKPELWESSIYMPITRCLSPGKRKLLVRWVTKLQNNPEPPIAATGCPMGHRKK
ncbi:MAG: hypothetical protein HON94_16420 [Methylococcales bacterium]|jgi:hypothetical protein|nr:hypothetical protein [Methylococcales bacterium]MBT7409316.1 hypothetical protein [Methylococcales bacterium]